MLNISTIRFPSLCLKFKTLPEQGPHPGEWTITLLVLHTVSISNSIMGELCVKHNTRLFEVEAAQPGASIKLTHCINNPPTLPSPSQESLHSSLPFRRERLTTAAGYPQWGTTTSLGTIFKLSPNYPNKTVR